MTLPQHNYGREKYGFRVKKENRSELVPFCSSRGTESGEGFRGGSGASSQNLRMPSIRLFLPVALAQGYT
eukprot:scaffold61850_cov21-Tisochrysis_lutea.AAC.3